MKTITVRPRIPKSVAVGLIKNLGPILSGKEIDQHGVRDVFFGTMAFELYSRIRRSFLQKSSGSTDELGASWQPLSESTIKRRVASWFNQRHPGSSDLNINRVDDTLLKSLSPGEFNGYTYTPSANQYFNYQGGSLRLGSSLKYAVHVHTKRELWPKDMTPWIQESLSLAIEATLLHIKRMIE